MVISKTGILKISFNHEFKIYGAAEIDSKVLDFSLITNSEGDDIAPSPLKWVTTEFLSDSVTINVQFDDPLAISATGEENKDEIRISLLNNFYF